MELLAPAGSKESLISAIEAGADSVYAGIDGFNARRNAKNFNLYDLQVMTDYLHSKKKKIYIALNILLKEREISEVFLALDRLVPLGIDGIILQDLGLLGILRAHFPRVPLHASTQMAVHNTAGLRFLESSGFSRAILARELSIKEIQQIHASTSIDLEVFCHGALCFSLSGLCMASSFFGGSSGNRGLCTQPCRRPWKFGRQEGFIFSTKDLQAIRHLGHLEKIGVRTLKIEGRMRGPEYVARVVAGYRRILSLLEKKEHCITPEDYYLRDFSREKTTYFMDGRRGTIVEPQCPGTMGERIGIVESQGGGVLRVKAEKEIAAGYRVRICAERDEEALTLTLKEISIDNVPVEAASPGEICEIYFDRPVKPGALLYLVGTSAPNDSFYRKKIDAIYKAYKSKETKHRPCHTGKTRNEIMRKMLYGGKKSKSFSHLPMVRIDDLGWLKLLDASKIGALVISLDSNGFEPQWAKKHLGAFKTLIIDLPPFIPEAAFEGYYRRIVAFNKKGYDRWMLENPAHLSIFKEMQAELMAGPFLYTMNSLALRELERNGVRGSVASYEDELINIRDLLARYTGRRVVPVFAYVPVFMTRIDLGGYLKDHDSLSQGGMDFFICRRGEITYIVGSKPLSLLQYRPKLEHLGVHQLMLDLSFSEPSAELWGRVMGAYDSSSAFMSSTRFNFKRGLK
jgi:U32 family peptidase